MGLVPFSIFSNDTAEEAAGSAMQVCSKGYDALSPASVRGVMRCRTNAAQGRNQMQQDSRRTSGRA
jgi:hypothetical protein